MRVDFIKFAAVLVSVFGVAACFGQTIQKLPPPSAVKAIRESTYTVVPQINPVPNTIRREHVNPFEDKFRGWLHVGEPNHLPLGGILPNSRISLDPVHGFARFPGIQATGWVPADPTAAVSSTHIVEIVNSSIAFFLRDGTKTFEQRIDGSSGFFGSLGAGDFVFDPKSFFDPNTKRFFIIALEEYGASSTSFFDIGVSANEDPNGTWLKYRIPNKLVSGGNSYWLDYPGFGFNKDWVVASGNMFPFSNGGFGGVQVFAFPKANLIAGNTNGTQIFLDTSAFTIQWGKNVDTSLDDVYAVMSESTSSLRIYALQGSSSSVKLVSKSISVPNWSAPTIAAMSGSSAVDPLDGRMLTVAYRNGHLAASHTVDSGQSDHRNSARWYDFNTQGWPDTAGASPSLVQSGQLDGAAGEHLFDPAVNINKNGSIGMVLSRCSSAIPMDMLLTGRKPTDPLGSMGKLTTVVSSTGSYPFWRWGDFFSVEVDPVNSRSFWGIAMTIRPDGDWSTDIDTWKVIDISDAVAFTVNSAALYQGSSSKGNTEALKTVDGSTYDITSVNMARVGSVAAIQASFTSTIPASQLDTPIYVNITATSPAGTTCQVFAKNVSTGKYDVIQQLPFTGLTTVSITAQQVPTYVNGSGVINLVVRALGPQHLSAKPFVAKFDQIQVLGLPAF